MKTPTSLLVPPSDIQLTQYYMYKQRRKYQVAFLLYLSGYVIKVKQKSISLICGYRQVSMIYMPDELSTSFDFALMYVVGLLLLPPAVKPNNQVLR
jgi:hypothetical protein